MMAVAKRKLEVFKFPQHGGLVFVLVFLTAFLNFGVCDNTLSDNNAQFSPRQAKDYSVGGSSSNAGGYGSAGTVYAAPASGYGSTYGSGGSTYGSGYGSGTSYPPPHYAVAPIVLVRFSRI